MRDALFQFFEYEPNDASGNGIRNNDSSFPGVLRKTLYVTGGLRCRSSALVGQKWPDCVRDDSWLIVALLGSHDETSKQVHTGQRGENGPGYPQSQPSSPFCRREDPVGQEFLEAGKKRLAGDTAREATSDEVKELKAEARQLKETLAEVLIENRHDSRGSD